MSKSEDKRTNAHRHLISLRGGRIDPTRKRWCEMHECDLVEYHVPNDQELRIQTVEHEEGWGESHILLICAPNSLKRNMAVDLTGFTEEELDTFKEFINKAVEDARPTVQMRDQRALEAHHDNINEGKSGSVYARLYRSVPHVVDLTRPKPQHRESVPGRPDGDAEEDGDVPAE